MSCTISHSGVVRSVSDEMIVVSIAAKSSCGDCHAKTICGFSEISEKLVHIKPDCDKQFKPGDEIQVVMDSSIGTKAVLWAYMIPLFILMATVLICMQFMNELASFCIACTLLGCHFFLLHKNKQRFERNFSFKIKKTNV